jgi:hypothetical protein
MAGYLIDQDSSEQYALSEPLCKIGSATGNNLVLTFPDIQDSHVKIENRNGTYFISLAPGANRMRKFLLFFDIPSAKHNGSTLDGNPKKLSTGDKVLIGSRLFEFRMT